MDPNTTDTDMTRADMRALIEQQGGHSVDNTWIYGRLPPGTCCGMHPAGCRENGPEGNLYSRLIKDFEAFGLQKTPSITDPKAPFAEAAKPPAQQPVIVADLNLTPDRRPG